MDYFSATQPRNHLPQRIVCGINISSFAPVAHLDRVLGYEPRGSRFESCPAHQNIKKAHTSMKYGLFLCSKTTTDFTVQRKEDANLSPADYAQPDVR